VSTLMMQSAGVRFKPRARIALVPWGVQLALVGCLVVLLLLLVFFR
jgi:hypothetical protein